MTTHTDLAAQAREMATTLRSIAIPAQYERNAASLLEQCAAALSTERLAGGGEPSWENSEGWESLAWELCADENGEDSCNELVWEGGPVPEPWGERWLKYEDEAKRLIALVHKHVPATPPPQAERVPLSPGRLADQLQGVDYTPSCRRAFIDGVRFAERSHGIGTPKEST